MLHFFPAEAGTRRHLRAFALQVGCPRLKLRCRAGVKLRLGLSCRNTVSCATVEGTVTVDVDGAGYSCSGSLIIPAE